MIRVFLFSILALLSLTSMQAWAEATADVNLHRGNVEVGGAFGGHYSTYGSYYHLNANAEYFLLDRLSVGGAVTGGLGDASHSLAVGPSLTYYFWLDGKWAGYVGSGLSYLSQNYDSVAFHGNDYLADAKIGVSYFITPSVAFGPQLMFTRSLQNPDASGGDTQALFQFSIYL